MFCLATSLRKGNTLVFTDESQLLAWSGFSLNTFWLKYVNIFPSTTSGLPRWLSGKESACNAGDTGDTGLIPGSERSPGEGNVNPLQYSCLENPTDSEPGRLVHKVAKSWTWLKQLSKHAHRHLQGTCYLFRNVDKWMNRYGNTCFLAVAVTGAPRGKCGVCLQRSGGTWGVESRGMDS